MVVYNLILGTILNPNPVTHRLQRVSSFRRPLTPLLSLFYAAGSSMASSLCFLPFLLFALSSASASTSATADLLHGGEEIEAVGHDLYRDYLRDEAASRLNELGKVSDVNGYLERTFLSPASVRAANIISQWMEDAGLRTWVDIMGNVHGRVDGMNASAPALLMGSHLDTVVDAGKFDGALGIVSTISALKVLKVTEKLENLRNPVEVIAFSDEEGVRFQSTFLGSAAIAGILPASTLNISDKSGITLQEVLNKNAVGVTEDKFIQLKYQPESVLGYVEVHIEQGPVLESAGIPLGVVKGIAGQTRLKVTFTVDLRAMDDAGREAVLYELSARMYNICDKRSVSCVIERKHDANAVKCDNELSLQLQSAALTAFRKMAGNVDVDVPKLMSGAGHDAMAMAHLTKMGMLFVRCRGGISHSPAEHVLDDDVWAAGLAVLAFLENHV
ncbi:allantoate deiminase 2-like isoform X2 [Chenopodium quinoa]|uniref:allantoate deiminase 2-like isoform X2 n=1 Tax=Chenopodium quinoa TaxID=63459 RepID=UPI000B779A46|nr:allantoate deiminase 2-like isoform X2 [Chenopodium quinoa]